MTKFIVLQFFHVFEEEQMMGIFIDIFIAGAETTSYTLGFALLYMMDNPHVQAKVQTEIDQVLQGRQPSITDRARFHLNT